MLGETLVQKQYSTIAAAEVVVRGVSGQFGTGQITILISNFYRNMMILI